MKKKKMKLHERVKLSIPPPPPPPEKMKKREIIGIDYNFFP